MKAYSYKDVTLTSGYLFDKQELNRKITIDAVYDRFAETGRIGAFNFDYDPNKEGSVKPHVFWDSDVAKWIEGAAYVLSKHPDKSLEKRVDDIVERIKSNQCSDGYFNIYYTVVEPDARFTNRDRHELYCAGHLMEAAVALDKYCGKGLLLECMEKYADCIHRIFIDEKTASFVTPGHEEIELALMRMYEHTGKKKYLEMAAFFINSRGAVDEQRKGFYDQSHLPVREQTEALGHAVRALYLYTGMAYLAAETGEEELKNACRILWCNITTQKMYITGSVGSTRVGEAFTGGYDLPNDTAYAETCAAIGLVFFAHAMLALENDAKYADVIERALYNGVLSGLSLDGKAFFYTNPLEINLSEHFSLVGGGRTFKTMSRAFPITQRPEIFNCSCCPPNISRILPSLGNYVYAKDGDTLYVNQFVSSTLTDREVSCTQKTNFPNSGTVKLTAKGVEKVAVRIPSWCESFTFNKPYTVECGYAVIENDGGEIIAELDVTPKLVYADRRVMRNTGRVCITRGPIVYCAEGVDNGAELHSYSIPATPEITETYDEGFGLCTLKVACVRDVEFDNELYSSRAPKKESASLRLIPYNCFANRGESDMVVWLRRECL